LSISKSICILAIQNQFYLSHKTSYIAHLTRLYRKYHRYLGLTLLFFILISSLTGLLLAWKKDISLIQPPTQKGEKIELSVWMPIAELAKKAEVALQEAQPQLENYKIDRIDLRPSKGIAKCLFKKGYWEVQIEGKTGKILSIARRHSDWIEALHDGSIISNFFKLISMNFLGIGLLILGFSGFFLWYNPKRIRRLKKKKS
jgi:uncharacterized iron-regulated membrane protein